MKCQLRTWIHNNLCDLTINCDTGQHSQFLRCLNYNNSVSILLYYQRWWRLGRRRNYISPSRFTQHYILHMGSAHLKILQTGAPIFGEMIDHLEFGIFLFILNLFANLYMIKLTLSMSSYICTFLPSPEALEVMWVIADCPAMSFVFVCWHI